MEKRETYISSEIDSADTKAQLGGFHGDDKVWRQKAIKARDHMQRTRNLLYLRHTKIRMKRKVHDAFLSVRQSW